MCHCAGSSRFPVRDVEIRALLRRRLEQRYRSDPETIVLDEFSLYAARIDLAVVNGKLHGFEIKSDADILQRLDVQVPAYNAVFDQVTAVVAERHLSKVVELVPHWWAIYVPVGCTLHLKLRRVRGAKENPYRDAMQLARLLWRSEALSALRGIDKHYGLCKASADQVRHCLVSQLSLAKLAAVVRCAIRQRQRRVSRLSPGGDSCPTEPTAPDYRRNFEWLLSLRSQHLRR